MSMVADLLVEKFNDDLAEAMGLPRGGEYETRQLLEAVRELFARKALTVEVVSPDAMGGSVQISEALIGTPEWAGKFSKCMRSEDHKHRWNLGATYCTLCAVSFDAACGRTGGTVILSESPKGAFRGGAPPDGTTKRTVRVHVWKEEPYSDLANVIPERWCASAEGVTVERLTRSSALEAWRARYVRADFETVEV